VSVPAVRPRLSTPVLAVGLCLVWSTAFVFVELSLRDATAAQFAAMRSVAAVPALAVGLLVRDAAGLRGALRSSASVQCSSTPSRSWSRSSPGCS
jgi:hypothetical protein